ncbi:DUF2631 domain-containing protein [Gordonia sinesedis]
MASTEVKTGEHGAVDHPTIDTGWRREPADAPSARFGWHGVATKTFYIAGWFSVFAVLAMIIGNHEGRVEDLYLIGFAALMAYFLIKGMVTKKKWS